MSIEPKPSRSQKTNELLAAFVAELQVLSALAHVVAKSRRGALAESAATSGTSAREWQDKMLRLMNEIEASFRVIRKRLIS